MVSELFSPNVAVPWILGMLFGVFVGATPGLTATMAVALIVPVSFHLDPSAGLALIIGVSFTAIFAGDIPATFLRIPGTPASAAAVLDGHEMAKRGQGRFALTLDLFCSCIGGFIGVLLLVALAPQLARFALRFSNFEYFWLGILGLSVSAVVSQANLLRGVLAAVLGLLLSTVGIDVVSGEPRFTFGQAALLDGLSFIPVMIGLFGLSEVLRASLDSAPHRQGSAFSPETGVNLRALAAIWRHKWTVLKSALCGTVLGALPGAGADIAAWGAYGLAQKTSRDPKKFGTGCEEGVVAPTSANNAAVGGAWIPALVFGVPGDAVTAIVLGALLMYDIKPGPMLFETGAERVHLIFAIALITQGLLLVAGFIGIRAFGLIVRLPKSVILVSVTVFSFVGAFAMQHSLFDVFLAIGAGIAGFFMERAKAPLAPLVLGLILGPMVEENLRTGLIKTGGDFFPFVTRPICAVLLLLLVSAFAAGPLRRSIAKKIAPRGKSAR